MATWTANGVGGATAQTLFNDAIKRNATY